jgi:negative regulator of flagellin synthesis FlgM
VKINGGGSIKPVAPAGVQDVTAGKASGPQAGAAPAPARDTVEINSVSAQLAQLEKVLSEMGVVDSARVESIKQAISEGRFRIDSDVVADKLLATVREYLVNQKV